MQDVISETNDKLSDVAVDLAKIWVEKRVPFGSELIPDSLLKPLFRCVFDKYTELSTILNPEVLHPRNVTGKRGEQSVRKLGAKFGLDKFSFHL